MGERSDDLAREQRLSALRALAAQTAQDAEPATGTTPQPTFAPEALASGPEDAGRPGGRRGRLALAGALAALLIVALGAGYALRRGSAAHATTTAPALTARTFSVSAAGGLYCTMTPAWAPDSQRLAILGQTNPPQDLCEPYNLQVALAQLSGGQNVPYVSVNQAAGYALVIFDSAHGTVTQRITLPQPDPATLCGAWINCSINALAPQSTAWSPDGRFVAVFFTYDTLTNDGPSAPRYARADGGLLLVPVGAPGAQPRLLLAHGPQQPAAITGDPVDGLAAQRFTWNIATGAGTATAIHQALPQSQSLDTTVFAPAWQWDAAGALSPASAATAGGALSPWISGVVGLRQNADAPALYHTSQWAWSADGHTVTPNLATSVYLRLPGAAVPAAATAGYAPASVDAPDTATSAAIAASLISRAGVALARSPDGALLASYACEANLQTATLAIRAAKSADPLAQANYTYPYSYYSLACSGDIELPVWSPDGKHLAIGDEQDAQVTVWQASVRS